MAVITVSRQFGAEGNDVARRTADLLGYLCLNRELVAEVARQAGVSERQVARYDEKGQGAIADLLTRAFLGRAGTYGVPRRGPRMAPPTAAPLDGFEQIAQRRGGARPSPPLATPAPAGGMQEKWTPGPEDIISLIEQVIRTAADKGNVVVVGRGSQALLADRPDALHCRLVAPIEFRCQTVAQYYEIGAEEARALVQKTDRERERYIHQNYGVDWEDNGLYHLILNMARTDVEVAAQVIACAATQGRKAEVQEKPR